MKKIKSYLLNAWYTICPKYQETPIETTVKELIIKAGKLPNSKIVLFGNSGWYLPEGYITANCGDEEINIVMSNSCIYIKNKTDFVELYCHPNFAEIISREIMEFATEETKLAKQQINTSKEKILNDIEKMLDN